MSRSQTTLEHYAEQKAAPADPDLLRIRDLIYDVCGIYVAEKRLYFLEDRCTRRVHALRAGTLRQYFRVLTAGPARDAEIREMLNEITVGDTCFFRNMAQLDALCKLVLPRLTDARGRTSPAGVKVWSCGCSTGEEPYTIAMMLLEAFAERSNGCLWELQATDLNDHSLRKATMGIYDGYALRHAPAHFQKKYFEPRGDKFVLSEEVKQRVRFTRLNLKDDSGLLGMNENNVIFCANVLIYFDGVSKRRVVQHLYKNLEPGGYLFLGNSESLRGVTEEFRLVHFPRAIAYLRP